MRCKGYFPPLNSIVKLRTAPIASHRFPLRKTGAIAPAEPRSRQINAPSGQSSSTASAGGKERIGRSRPKLFHTAIAPLRLPLRMPKPSQSKYHSPSSSFGTENNVKAEIYILQGIQGKTRQTERSRPSDFPLEKPERSRSPHPNRQRSRQTNTPLAKAQARPAPEEKPRSRRPPIQP